MNKFFIILLFSFTLLCGCSSKYAYNNIDWLLYWYMDEYIDLDKSQKRIFDSELDSWLIWHRASELPKYEEHLRLIQIHLQNGVASSEQWMAHFDLAGQHWYRVRAKLTPDITGMAIHLSDHQINELFDKLEDKNIEFEKERAEQSVAQRATENIEDMQARVKDWIGHLNSEQKNIIAVQTGLLESNFLEWMVYRRKIQSLAKSLLLQRHVNVDFETDFLALVSQPEVYQSQSFINRSERNKQILADLLAQISEGLSAKQMKKFNKEIQVLIDSIKDLVNQ